MTFVVRADSVSKNFRLYSERHRSFKDKLLRPGQGVTTDFTALSDVSFEISSGETVGILGRNGSGKSTLLKCICGVLRPTSGQVLVRGSLAGLLELGAGFQPELSGRDNVYLSASMLGMSTKSVDAIFDDIVGFAELEQFIDTPVKFYSSGMYVRLGFSVAVSVEPEILVVDEVLAVGDERFQAKCMDRIRQFQRDGRTILLVSHNADQVRTLCDRTLVLDRSQLAFDGPAADGVRVFRERLMGTSPVAGAAATRSAGTIDAVSMPSGRFVATTGEKWEMSVAVTANEPIEGHFVMELHDERGELMVRSDWEVAPVSLSPGSHVIHVDSPSMSLLDGAYQVSVGIVSDFGSQALVWREQAAVLEVTYRGRGAGIIQLAPRVRVS
jgi:ABC-2 type transport system ATP-binding protein